MCIRDRTSAHLHYRTAGDKAARLLLDMLADPHAEPQMIKLDYELKCRAATGAVSYTHLVEHSAFQPGQCYTGQAAHQKV